MSLDATRAAWSLIPHLDKRLAEVDPEHRPSPNVARLILLCLADKYRDSRGYVDETHAQLADATGASAASVKDTLWTLDALGMTSVLTGC
jgi:hypothetical protein